MPFLLVGDNRSNSNWGGRAGSLALFGLLRDVLGGGESIFGTELTLAAANYGFRSRLFPGRLTWRARTLAQRAAQNPLAAGFTRLDRALGGGDFLVDQPTVSVRNLMSRRRSDPGLQHLYDRVARADMIVINGEGDTVLGRPVRRQIRFFAAVAHLAAELHKPTVFTNAMLSDCTQTGRDPVAFALMRDTLERCDLVTVRDRSSLQLVREEMGIDGCRLVPDSLFHWYELQHEARRQLPERGDFVLPHPEHEEWLGHLDFSRDYICVGGNSAVTRPGVRDEIMARTRDLCAAMCDLGYPVHVVIADGRDTFLEKIASELGLGVVPLGTPIYLAAAILGRARLLVSGRYHPSIMAALGGTPCLYLEANVHKMQSLAELLDESDDAVFPATPGPEDRVRIVAAAQRRLDEGHSLRTRIQANAAALAAEVNELGPMVAAVVSP